ncbi:MAG TPA: hypothetical protein VM076_03690 [Gemmatimonadaceae bacterium]|nr:hypothetical protein [Gemmatimonadaceae bacterium]
MVRTSMIIPLGCLVAGACTIEKHAGSGTDTSATKSPAATADSAASLTPPPASTAWTVTPSGVGPIRVGMTADDLRRVAGDFTVPVGAGECTYVRPANAPSGVAVMLASGSVARVDVDSTGVQSDAGVAIGDSASRASTAYAGRVSTTPHKYVQGGQYLTVRSASPADSSLRIVFESEAGRITRFRSGRVPEVEQVERCG